MATYVLPTCPERFCQGPDKYKTPHFVANISYLPLENRELPGHSAIFFPQRFLLPLLVRSSIFSTDLTTNRDDIILAFLSMCLLLIIEGILQTLLLSTLTKDGRVSSFGLSVKCIIEVLRDFDWKFKQLRTAPREKSRPSGKGTVRKPVVILQRRLVIISVCVIVFVLGLETGVLLLSSPSLTPVSNKLVSFRIGTSTAGQWLTVRRNVRATIGKPCQSTKLRDVEHGKMRVLCCVLGNVTGIDATFFKDGDVREGEMVLESRVHKYGAEHFVRVGEYYAEYVMRGYMVLEDGRERVIKRDEDVRDEERTMEGIHRMFVAYLYSVHGWDFKGDLKVEDLNLMEIEFNVTDPGPDVTVLKIEGGDAIIEKSTVYKSRMRGLLPMSAMSLHVAHQFWRASSTLKVVEGDEWDLFVDDGVQKAESVVWWEKSRKLNWVSLLLMVVASLMILGLLRMKMKPETTVNIASHYVKRAVGAHRNRSPMEIDEDKENRYFGMRGAQGAESLGTVPISGGTSIGERESSFAFSNYSIHED